MIPHQAGSLLVEQEEGENLVDLEIKKIIDLHSKNQNTNLKIILIPNPELGQDQGLISQEGHIRLV